MERIPFWKLPHIMKGIVSTFAGPLNAWHFRRGHTGGTDSPQYCLSNWSLCLRMLCDAGFDPRGCRMAELGPGDSVGVGLAALLSGVGQYVGLDVVPYSRCFNPAPFFEDLIRYAAKYDTPSVPVIPEHELRCIRDAVGCGLNGSEMLQYKVPWSAESLDPGSQDLILSIGVLQHMDRLEDSFQIMYEWLRPGGYACHLIPCTALFLSPYWNGHWAYSDLEWRLVRGRRPFLINRQPMSGYLKASRAIGFEVITAKTVPGRDGLPQSTLARPFRNMDALDANTRQLRLVLRRPVPS